MAARESIRSLVEAAAKAATRRDFACAIVGLEAALLEDPTNLRALDLAGYALFFEGRFAEAEQMCRRALAASPDHAYAHKGLGLSIAKQGRTDDGIASLRRAIALRPGWADPYWDLGVVLRNAGRVDDALDVLARGAEAVPDRRADFETFRKQLGG